MSNHEKFEGLKKELVEENEQVGTGNPEKYGEEAWTLLIKSFLI